MSSPMDPLPSDLAAANAIRRPGSPTCSLASPTPRRTGCTNCCPGIGKPAPPTNSKRPDRGSHRRVTNEIGEREEERRRYFESFLSNQSLRCTISSQKKRASRKLGTVVIGGLYTFDFIRDGRAESVPARFLFTFEEIDGRWLITGHHSSGLSEAI